MEVLVGSLLGALSGMGIGGGSLLMLWLTAVLDMPARTARSINLMFFLPCALISTLLRRRKALAEPAVTRTAALSALAGAAAGNLLQQYIIEETALQMVLGGLFVAAGIRELCYRERKFR